MKISLTLTDSSSIYIVAGVLQGCSDSGVDGLPLLLLIAAVLTPTISVVLPTRSYRLLVIFYARCLGAFVPLTPCTRFQVYSQVFLVRSIQSFMTNM